MQPEFWLKRWQTGEIGFHQRRIDPQLETYWPQLRLAPQSSVFVPLCGKSLDLAWLHERGHEVLGVELSLIAVEAFFLEQGIAARRRRCGAFELFASPRLTLWQGDFYALDPTALGAIAAVYDRAALICWPAPLRCRYVEAMTSLTQPGTQTLLVVLEYAPGEMSGPPFSVSAADVAALYGGAHSVRECARQDILETEPRLRAKGLTRLQQVCYHLVRR